jgi:hypothetical protein
MTDLRGQLARLLDDEPEPPYDVDRIVRSGRRARLRRNVALAAAGTAGAAGLAAAVAVPALTLGGDEATDTVDVPPTPSPTASKGTCYLVMGGADGDLQTEIDKLIRSGKVGENPSIIRVRHGSGQVRAVCTAGTTPQDLQRDDQQPEAQPPAGPPYSYTEEPEAIASRLGDHLRNRVDALGLTVSYTRPFSQETSNLDSGHPSYYAGNVDVHESNGYADIGVQVIHEVTELVPFTGDCTADEHCTETVLPDGSVLRTGRVDAGRDNVLFTAEVHRPDGVIVQAQESNYPFGPDAGTQPHGDLPLTLDQLVALAQDERFTF